MFIDGKKAMTLRGDDIGAQFKAIVEGYVKNRWGCEPAKSPPMPYLARSTT